MQNNITQYLMYGLLVIGVIVLVISLGGSYDAMLYTTYAYFGLTLLIGLGGAIAGIIAKPQAAKNIIISTVSMAVVLGIAYALADGSDSVNYEDVSEGAAKFSGMLIYSFYILMFGAVAAVVFSGVNKLIR